ncbi:putative aluminum-activated malate transporter [Helianthus annuus]|uniref:Aluminum-activated malate transporter n=1 Tax=Helianthus annuus TaxID=4232 RepID=A0A251RL87_HELAN|nr:aluminum-activated malate transporter 10 [Helianthus annuus]KAF5753447.1 putative aluminum-activated malate transporter [Helianthus annuus]KAJ0824283.1 putative aluminum-activated malate transporter [Helianthus annuus]
MANKNGVEWSIRLGDGSSMALEPEPEPKYGVMRLWDGLKGLVVRFVMRVWMFLKKAWNLGVDDPRKFLHSLKVGIALMAVSLFYYMRPLYDGVGGNAIWAVMTVVVVFEYTVGGTLSKCLNRMFATTLAGFLALGIHWIASHLGHEFEPYIMGISLFLLASATTFSRFIPIVKARFDYGCMIFILTYSLVSVSGYRVDNLLRVAHERLSTIIIGTCLCIITSMLIFPVWAGLELHLLIPRNMDKLAKSLDCCVADYFGRGDEESKKSLQGYKCVLNSKTSEEAMANFARWEPAHGRFNFRHPWKNYLKIGMSTRNCAYCIETLTSCLTSKNKVPESIKKHLEAACMNLSTSSSNVIRELATVVSSMTRSAKINMAVEDMKSAVLELQNDLKSLPDLLIQTHEHKDENKVALSEMTIMPLIEIMPLVSFASLLIEMASRIEENMVKTVEELAESAKFKKPEDEVKPKHNQTSNKINASNDENITVLQRV